MLDPRHVCSIAIGKDDPFVTMLMMAVREGDRRYIGVQTRPADVLLKIPQGYMILEVHTN